ncbi:hypothetical protein [Helicobacter pylori]|uniref:hypothetical protein n=1 Tax=Helicobacter pylori TaxID=210 RepID=UPI0036F4337E
MRQKHETEKSFNQLKEITQIMQTQKRSAQDSDNANISMIASQRALKPKAKARAKNYDLNPTKRAFSERQITTIRDNSQAKNKKCLKTEQCDNSNLRAEPSDETFKQGLATQQPKRGK